MILKESQSKSIIDTLVEHFCDIDIAIVNGHHTNNL